MRVWFVSRHPGAVEWMKQQKNWSVDYWVEHLEISAVNKGDIVVGVLPFYVAAEICAKDAEFFALNLPLKRAQRGVEHTAEEIVEMGGYLQKYSVQALDK